MNDTMNHLDAPSSTGTIMSEKLKKRLKPFINGIDGMVFICSAGKRIEFASDSFSKWLGREDISGLNCDEVLGNNTELCPWCPLERVISGKTLRHQVRDHRTGRWFSVVSTPITVDENVVLKMTVMEDITDNKHAEIDLKTTKDMATRHFKTAPAAMFTLDGDMKITGWNDKAGELTGYRAEEMLGKSIIEIVDGTNPGDCIYPEGVLTAKTEKKCTFVKRNGALMNVSLRINAVTEESGTISGAIVWFEDITANISEQERGKLLLELADASSTFIGIAGMDGTVEYINKAGLELFGVSSLEEARTKKMFDFTPESSLDELKGELLPELIEKRAWSGEKKIRNITTGSLTDVLIDTYLIRDKETGEPRAMGSIMHNMTNHHRLLKQFQKAESIESITKFAGSVAQDFNNILTTILGYGDIILDEPEDRPTVIDSAQEIRNAVERASTLTRRLIQFSDSSILNPSVIDIGKTLEFMEQGIKRALGDISALEITTDPALWTVSFDSSQFKQVIMHIVSNARDAMPEGGKLTIAANNTVIEKINETPVPVKPGSYVHIRLDDEGFGMTEDVLEHVFEPFYTTKTKDEGLGLGLSTCYSVVRKNGGAMWIASEPGKGTTVEILIPKSSDMPESETLKSNAFDVKGGSETILVVDDEAMVRTVMTRILRTKGYTVLDACDSEDALRVAKDFGEDRISLLLTDVVLPGKNGVVLAGELSSINPGMKVLFVSGHYHKTVDEITAATPTKRFLSKPFSTSALLTNVRSLLDCVE